MMIRPAKKSDAAFIAKKVLQAITLHDDIVQNEIDELSRICEQEDTLYSYCNSMIAELDGKPVGLALCYPGEYYHAMRAKTFPKISYFRGTNPDEMPDETLPGEFYLDSLAVEPSMRGKGIGRQLLRSVKQKANKLNLTAALLVEPNNERAKHVYQSEGFLEQELRPAFGHVYRVMRIL